MWKILQHKKQMILFWRLKTHNSKFCEHSFFKNWYKFDLERQGLNEIAIDKKTKDICVKIDKIIFDLMNLIT